MCPDHLSPLPGTSGAELVEGTYPARVALQELDLLEELDVVRAQAVQLALQGLDGVLRQAVLLGAGRWAGGQVGRASSGRRVARGLCAGTGPALSTWNPCLAWGRVLDLPASAQSCLLWGDPAPGRSHSSWITFFMLFVYGIISLKIIIEI